VNPFMVRRRSRQAAYRERSTIETPYGDLHVTRRKRCVRVTVRMPGGRWAYIDLHDAGIDKLVGRLQRVRGGKRADGARVGP
jgi:hypothetical protein